MVKRLIISLAAFLFILAVINGCALETMEGQQKRGKDVGRQSISAEVLIAEVSSAPPEIAADLLIKIAESKVIGDKQKRIELLDEAFRRASGVQQKLRLKAWAGLVDTRSGYLSAAYDLKLDALSLKCRAVKAMLALDTQRARSLFSEIPKLRLTSLGCTEVLGYDVSEFYQTLQQIEQKSFSKEERTQGYDAQFISSYLDDLVSPAQVGPVFNLIANSQSTDAELGVLIARLSSALKKILKDPRSFALSMKYGDVIAGLQRLIGECEQKKIPTSELLSSFRSYVVGELSSAQCSDALVESDQQHQDQSIAYVNKWFSNPIRLEDIKPLRVETAGQSVRFWASSDSAQLLMKVKKLRFGTKQTPLTLEERSTLEWQQSLTQLLTELEIWDGEKENTETDYFHEKCVLYKTLFDLASNREDRMRILLSLAHYLRDTSIAQQSRIEWLLHANYLVEKVRSMAGPERSEILGIFKNSGNQGLQLYAEFSDLSPPA
jgi:hypothetical protein